MVAARRIGFAGLSGWMDDDHAAALSAYRVTEDLLGAGWPRHAGEPPRRFFERHFAAVRIGEGPGLVTGYYEPELEGAETPDDRFRFPLHALPAALPENGPWFSRAEIAEGDLLAGTELVWLSSAVDVFFAQVQGSARVRLADGRYRRFGYAGRNGHPYRSIGAVLVARGAVSAQEMSAAAIRDWCAAHPEEVPELLACNPSYVFFRPLDLAETSGPIGALGRPVTADRSIAVDPAFIPLGAPVWVETSAGNRLMIAQDTGSAIKGPQRADHFCGSGAAAGDRAGSMRLAARLVTLLPRHLAAETLS